MRLELRRTSSSSLCLGPFCIPVTKMMMATELEEEEEEDMKGKREMRIGKSFERVIVEIVIGSIALMRIYPSARMPQWAMSSLHVFVLLPLFFSLIQPTYTYTPPPSPPPSAPLSLEVSRCHWLAKLSYANKRSSFPT